MKATKLRGLGIEELEVKLSEMEEEQLRRRCNAVISQLPNVQLIKQGRKEIARIKTILNEKRRKKL